MRIINPITITGDSMSEQQEKMALEALRRMDAKQLEFAMTFLLKMAPARPSPPILKLISGRRG